MESLTKDPALRWPAEMVRYGARVLSRGNLFREGASERFLERVAREMGLALA